MWILLRALVICLLWLVPLGVISLLPTQPGDTGLGVGLLIMAATVLLAFGWALLDGLRARRPPTQLLFAWLIAAMAMGVLSVLQPQLGGEPGFDPAVLRADLVLAPTGALMVLVPAGVGLGVGMLARMVRASRKGQHTP